MEKSECSPIPDIISFALFFWQGSSEWTSVGSLILRHEGTLSQSLSRGKVHRYFKEIHDYYCSC